MQPESIKLAIIGHGFVGKAIDTCFPSVKKLIIDLNNNHSIKDLTDFKPHAIFICLPTPMSDDGSINSKIIIESFKEIKELNIQTIKILKSTVTPDVLDHLSKNNKNLVYSPEFLREQSAVNDLINSEINILSGSKKDCETVKDIFKRFSIIKNPNFYVTDIKTASLVKYTINSFLASKVLFFNQMKDLFDKGNHDDSWENFIKLTSLDKRIGSSHMNVPGPDGKKGFGGACFPKDIGALVSYAKKIDVDLSVLKKVKIENDKIRSHYKKSDREVEQNIKFTK